MTHRLGSWKLEAKEEMKPMTPKPDQGEGLDLERRWALCPEGIRWWQLEG